MSLIISCLWQLEKGLTWTFLYLCTATSAVWDQVMRHNSNAAVDSGSYINKRVQFDVQSAILERPSADGVLRMLTHIRIAMP